MSRFTDKKTRLLQLLVSSKYTNKLFMCEVLQFLFDRNFTVIVGGHVSGIIEVFDEKVTPSKLVVHSVKGSSLIYYVQGTSPVCMIQTRKVSLPLNADNHAYIS